MRRPSPSRPKGSTLSEVSPGIGPGGPGLELLLNALQSPVNIGMILRTAEVYRIPVLVLDLHGVLDDPVRLRTVEDFACGALTRQPPRRLADAAALVRLRAGRRLIATSLGPGARPLGETVLQPGDLMALGNEYDGLPDDLVAGAEARLHVPTPAGWLPKPRSHSPTDPARTAQVTRDGQPSLNVAITAGILCHAAYAGLPASPPNQSPIPPAATP